MTVCLLPTRICMAASLGTKPTRRLPSLSPPHVLQCLLCPTALPAVCVGEEDMETDRQAWLKVEAVVWGVWTHTHVWSGEDGMQQRAWWRSTMKGHHRRGAPV